MAQSKDLFDDTTMSFGEHLEVLRGHVFKAAIGLVLAVIVCLTFGDKLVNIIRAPIDQALLEHGIVEYVDEDDVLDEFDFWAYIKEFFAGSEPDAEETPPEDDEPADEAEAKKREERLRQTITVSLDADELAGEMHRAHPDAYPEPPPAGQKPRTIKVRLWAPEFGQFRDARDQQHKMITLTVQEAFMTYIKVAVVAGLLFSSPWIFYQLWLFVAAGLYPHERKYVYIYGPFSVGLFLVGAVFCFIFVFPFVLNFLLGFNKWLGVIPQIRLSEWISFAVVMPLMFGISFELPLVMLFLERINVFTATTYREKRRLAILVIAIISMFLTPADPMSMMLMMVPLVLLYELGILLCGFTPSTKSPFEEETA